MYVWWLYVCVCSGCMMYVWWLCVWFCGGCVCGFVVVVCVVLWWLCDVYVVVVSL